MNSLKQNTLALAVVPLVVAATTTSASAATVGPKFHQVGTANELYSWGRGSHEGSELEASGTAKFKKIGKGSYATYISTSLCPGLFTNDCQASATFTFTADDGGTLVASAYVQGQSNPPETLDVHGTGELAGWHGMLSLPAMFVEGHKFTLTGEITRPGHRAGH